MRAVTSVAQPGERATRKASARLPYWLSPKSYDLPRSSESAKRIAHRAEPTTHAAQRPKVTRPGGLKEAIRTENKTPTPVTCALCNSSGPFDTDRSWIHAGFGGRLYFLCTLCLDERHPGTRCGPNGEAVFYGTATLADIEKRLEAVEKTVQFPGGLYVGPRDQS